MEQDKKLHSLLVNYGMQEPSANFDDKLMQRIANIKLHRSPAPQLINRIPHDPPSWLFWVTQHGVRMTGMPAWAGVLSDEDIWKIVAFIKNSANLPPEAQAAWQAAARSQ